jgi:hypothetical protein
VHDSVEIPGPTRSVAHELAHEMGGQVLSYLRQGLKEGPSGAPRDFQLPKGHLGALNTASTASLEIHPVGSRGTDWTGRIV